MPLFIEGSIVVEAPRSVKDFHHLYKVFEESSKVITDAKAEAVGPVGLLYIAQREYAGTRPDDGVIKVMGSEDATTCHIGVLRHTGSGAMCMLHFDGCETQEGLQGMIQLVLELSHKKEHGRLELHLIGGFEDVRKNSEEVSLDLLNCLVNCDADVHLMTACIGEHNTMYKNHVPFPIIYGIAADVKTGQIFNAAFPDHGPDIPLRSARHFGVQNNLLIYNWKTRQLVFGPFSYEPLANLDMLLQMPGEFYRKHMSTSPAQEPASFEVCMRQCLQFMKDNPDPHKTVFPSNAPRCYNNQADGKWQLI